MVDLKAQYISLKDELEAKLQEVLLATQFILGPNVQALEKEVAEYIGTKHAVACASGTDALHLALLATGIKAGDEVITTPFTFIATAEAISYIGAKPVFADIAPDTWNIDPEEIKKKITSRTKAVIPVHLFGHPAEMGAILEIANAHGLKADRGLRAELRGRIQVRQDRFVRGCGLFFVFSQQEPGLLRRRRDGHHGQRQNCRRASGAAEPREQDAVLP